MPLYNIVMPYLRHFGSFCRRLGKLDGIVVYIACGSGWIITTSAWVYFLEKSFRVPKVVPKLIGEIVEDDKLLLYDFPMTTITAANIVDMF